MATKAQTPPVETAPAWRGIAPQRADFRLLDQFERTPGTVTYLWEIAYGLDPSDSERFARELTLSDTPDGQEVTGTSLQWQWTEPTRHEVIGVTVTYRKVEQPAPADPFRDTVYGMPRAQWDRYGVEGRECPEWCSHGGTCAHARAELHAFEAQAEGAWLVAAESGFDSELEAERAGYLR